MTSDLSTFVVFYSYATEMATRRTPHREAHLAFLRELADAGRMILAGAVLDPVDGAVLVVRAEDGHAVRRMLLDDPYAKANLITAVTVRPIGLAIGG